MAVGAWRRAELGVTLNMQIFDPLSDALNTCPSPIELDDG